MKWLRKAAIGGVLAMLGAICLAYLLEYVLGIYFELSMIIVFSVLIGACTGLIYCKLDEVKSDICAIVSEQEKIKCVAERTDRNVRQMQRDQVASAENGTEKPDGE